MTALEILKQHQIKKTSARLAMINILQASQNPVSESEMKVLMSDLYDRITFYRNINTLSVAGIIHKIVVDNTTVRYGLNCCENGHKHQNGHAHFYCEKCDTVICMKEIKVPEFDLPTGFELNDSDIIIKGKCTKCNQ